MNKNLIKEEKRKKKKRYRFWAPLQTSEIRISENETEETALLVMMYLLDKLLPAGPNLVLVLWSDIWDPEPNDL